MKRQRKILPRLKIQKKTDKEITSPLIMKLLQSRKEKSEQNDEPEQKAPASGNKEAGGNQSNAGNGGQTTDSPKDNAEQSKARIRGIQSTECCVTCNSKVSGRRMITTQQNLQNHLNDGSITQEEYNEYYPYDGMEGSYYSVFL